MLNTLANHGFLNHNGKGITRGQIDNAFSTWLNIDNDFAEFLFNNTLLALSDPEDTAIDLDNLDAHNLVEHDGSLRYISVLLIEPNLSFEHVKFSNSTLASKTKPPASNPSCWVKLSLLSKISTLSMDANFPSSAVEISSLAMTTPSIRQSSTKPSHFSRRK